MLGTVVKVLPKENRVTSGHVVYDCIWRTTVVLCSAFGAEIRATVDNIVTQYTGVFQQDNAHTRTTVVTQRSLQSVHMLSWLAGSPDLSLIKQVWDIIRHKLPQRPYPALAVPC
ncbi:hypothetical protein TNCV_3647591 [Trichonephila clavipes]|nr:hypothetical protein TNCV_3647591 [Trichonephila clavipes]